MAGAQRYTRRFFRVVVRPSSWGSTSSRARLPVSREARDELRRATGGTTIPVLVFDDGSALVGEERIGAYLDAVHEPPEGRYRLKAAKARRRYLEEECQC